MIRKKTQKSGRITDRDFNMEMTLSPRQKRKRRRGCPSIEAYESLAQTYIDLQSKLWPELVKNGELPKRLTDALVQRMARDSYDRFVEEEPPVVEEQSPVVE